MGPIPPNKVGVFTNEFATPPPLLLLKPPQGFPQTPVDLYVGLDIPVCDFTLNDTSDPNPNPSGNFTKITQRLPIRIAIEQDRDLLRPGMMVEVDIEIGAP